MPLTDISIRTAKPGDKPYKLADGDGMFLLVHTNGSKYWRLKYRFVGKEKLLALGKYPETSLGEAREKRNLARKLLASGIDPSAKKKEDKRLTALNTENTFRAIAVEWHEGNAAKWIPAHGAKILRRLELHIFPNMGNRPIKEIRATELLDALRKVEKQGSTHLSHRLLQSCNAIFRYGVATSRAEYNPAADLQGALRAHSASNYPTLEMRQLPDFYNKLESANTSPINKIAVKILLLTFVRTGEMRQGRWEHIDWEAKEWRIPAEHTKMRERHIVPLSRQVINLLTELKATTGSSGYLFPSQNRQKNPIMSENTINMVIKKMGYSGQMVGHGFRALASTALNERGFRPDIIERQLAHAERNKVRAAYNRAEYLTERREMMQSWADIVDSLIFLTKPDF